MIKDIVIDYDRAFNLVKQDSAYKGALQNEGAGYKNMLVTDEMQYEFFLDKLNTWLDNFVSVEDYHINGCDKDSIHKTYTLHVDVPERCYALKAWDKLEDAVEQSLHHYLLAEWLLITDTEEASKRELMISNEAMLTYEKLILKRTGVVRVKEENPDSVEITFEVIVEGNDTPGDDGNLDD